MPVLATLLLGVVSAGLLFDQKLSLTHAAREAGRYGATIPSNQTFVAGTWAQNVTTLVKTRAAGELDASGASVCVALVEGSSGSSTNPLKVVSDATRSVSYFSTSGAVCNSTEVYPLTTYDVGRRVQIKVTRPGRIETPVYSISVLLSESLSVKSEASS